MVQLPLAMQRLIAFLGFKQQALQRTYVAEALWTDLTQEHAAASLRSVLWRMNRSGLRVVQSSWTHLSLAPEISVDVHEMTARAFRLIDPDEAWEPTGRDLELLTGELLPGWDEDWVITERDRLHQLRLHGLEALCDRLTTAGRFGQAVQAGMAAVSAEPLRESAWRALIQATLAEGNVGEAMKHYRTCREIILREFGIEPSDRIRQLVFQRTGLVW